LRRSQIRELKKRSLDNSIDPEFYKNKNVVNGGMNPTLILTSYEKKDEKKDDKGKKKKDEEVVQKEEHMEDIQNDE
jgi:hypothetical protein